MSESTLIRHVRKARFIKRTLGTRFAAGYLRNRGFDVGIARLVLARQFA